MSESSISMLSVSSVAPDLTDKQLAQQKLVVIVTRRNNPKNGPELATHERARFVLAPELPFGDIPSAVVSVLQEKLYEIASAQLKELWTETPNITEVPAALFTRDGLLMYAAKKAEAGRLSTESIEAWWQSSQLFARIAKQEDAAKRSENFTKYGKNGFFKIAAPVIPFSQVECEQLLKRLNDEPDQDHTILRQMAARLRVKINELKTQRQESFADEEL